MMLSIPQAKKIFASATPQESAMSRAKIAPAAARSDAVRGCSSVARRAERGPGAKHAAAASRSGAVRGRSLDTSPASANPGPLVRAAFVVAACTPARWIAGKWNCQCPDRDRVRGAVLAGTSSEPRQNQQVTEIAGELRPVLGFSGIASRYVRARVYARTRAHYARAKHRTTEPHLIIYADQQVSGSGVVLSRFWSEPAYRAASKVADFRRSGLNYRADNRLGLRSACSMSGSGGRQTGAAAKLLGSEFAGRPGAGRVGAVDRDQAQRGVGNGGFPWVSGCRSGAVGTAMLEQWVTSPANAGLSMRRRQLGRLRAEGRRVGLGAIGAAGAMSIDATWAEGVAPPSGPRPIPSPLAHAIFQISAASRFHDCPARAAETRQVLKRDIGSGKARRPIDQRATAGRGVRANFGLCRSRQGSDGGSDVN